MKFDPKTVTAAFARLFQTYPQFQGSDIEETMRVYFDAVAPYETRDIDAAISCFLTGSAPGHNPAFAPSAPLVAAEVRRQMNLRLDHEHRIRKPALPPPDIEKTPESRARVAAMVADMVERTAAEHRTDDAAKAKAAQWAKTNARFTPSMDPDDMRRRLMPYTAGDEDGDRDVA